jgi:hypothetical protein
MTTCTTQSIEWSTLTSARLDVVVDTDHDPHLASVEFAVVPIGTQPGGASWEAGTWVDYDSDLVTDKAASRDGIYGWLARTHLIGPLTDGAHVLWVRLTSGGGEQWVSPIDTIIVDGDDVGSVSVDSGIVVPLPQFGQLYAVPVGDAWTKIPFPMIVTDATVVTDVPPSADETWEIYEATSDDVVLAGTTTSGVTSPGSGTITTTLPATIPAGTYGFRFTARPGTLSEVVIVSTFGRFS